MMIIHGALQSWYVQSSVSVSRLCMLHDVINNLERMKAAERIECLIQSGDVIVKPLHHVTCTPIVLDTIWIRPAWMLQRQRTYVFQACAQRTVLGGTIVRVRIP